MFKRFIKYFATAKLKLSRRIFFFSSLRHISENSGDISIVSFSHSPLMSYGNGIAPYNPENNPSYQHVFDTIIRLNLGTKVNPLSGLIKQGNAVLIKVNLVEPQEPFYTRPEIVRPLIDMCRIAGASVIQIADGSFGYSHMQGAFENTGYTSMIRELQLKYPLTSIKEVNLCARDYWQWIDMEKNSFFYNSGLVDSDLFSLNHCLYKTQYYSTSDSTGASPHGRCMGWYSINKHVLDADVIINVPKLKVHGVTIVTSCLKHFVGCVVNNTHEDAWHAERIPHYNEKDHPNNPFRNEILWRAVGDVNKIILYADKNGRLRLFPQRKLLNIIDGINTAEKGNHSEWSGKLRVEKILMASIDPVAADAVACRIMGYNFRAVPSIRNLANGDKHPIGLSKPEQILILGNSINEKISQIYEFGDDWGMYASKNNLAIPTFSSPSIKKVEQKLINKSLRITANISRTAVAAYILYTVDDNMYFMGMKKKGSTFSAEINRHDLLEYTLVTHDKYFNTSSKTNKISY